MSKCNYQKLFWWEIISTSVLVYAEQLVLLLSAILGMVNEPQKWLLSERQSLITDQIIQRLAQQAELSPSYLMLMGISGTLAAIAMVTDSIPTLIGSMIIAPVFAPLVLVSFALVDGKPYLALQSLSTVLIGLMVATIWAMGTIWGLQITDVLPADANLLDHPLLEERVHPGWYNAAVALAAGIAGTIALIKQKIDTLIGTVSAIALVPAVAAAAVAFMSHDPSRGLGGLQLLAINVGLIILSGLATLFCISVVETDPLEE